MTINGSTLVLILCKLFKIYWPVFKKAFWSTFTYYHDYFFAFFNDFSNYYLNHSTSITLGELLIISISIILISIWGIFSASHIIAILISFELLLLGISLNFIFFSIFLNDILGQVFALLILTIAGAESAIGLALLLAFYRFRGDVSISIINSLKG